MAYITYSDLATYTGLTISNDSGADYTIAQANEIVERASKHAEDLCGTKFEATAVADEYHDGTLDRMSAQTVIVLNNAPLIQTVTPTVSIADEENGTLTATTDFFTHGDRELVLTSQTLAKGRKVAKVSYSYGDLGHYWEVRELALVLAAIEIAESPNGRNALLQNSKYIEHSAGDIAPPEISDTVLTVMKEKRDRLVKSIGQWQNMSNSFEY